MRRLVVLIGLSGCFGQLDANLRPSAPTSLRPAVQPKLSELPAGDGKAASILDQANTTPGPETPRKQLSGRWRTIETGAAFIAALLGSAASKSSNVTLGLAVTLDSEDAPPPKKPPPAPPVDSSSLVPWIPLPTQPR